ncbi:MAG: Ig-like domain-containing protein, partial [Verrucomicrobiota bacterium]
MADGAYGLQPVERLASGADGVVRSVEPATGAVLPGVDGPGQYLLVEVPVRPGVVEGVARDAGGTAREGLAVRTGPWLSVTDAAGRYRLVAPPGAGAVAVTDLRTGDNGSAGFALADAVVPVSVNAVVAAGGLRVVSVSPADGATGVSRVAPVVLAFSRPVNPASVLGGSIRLRDAGGQAVEAGVSLNLRGTAVTLLPGRPLAAGVQHTLELAETVTDAGGAPLEGERTYGFTTETDFVRRLDAGLTIFEPDAQGQAGMLGGAGLAEPGSAVILINETTGFTGTVLARVDGSFTNRVPADVDDTLSAVLVNRNGTRTVVPAGRQVFRDGSVALFEAGGTVDFGPADAPFTLVVEPGAVPGKTRFRLQGLAAEELTAATRGQAPALGRLLGGMRYQETGDPVEAAV